MYTLFEGRGVVASSLCNGFYMPMNLELLELGIGVLYLQGTMNECVPPNCRPIIHPTPCGHVNSLAIPPPDCPTFPTSRAQSSLGYESHGPFSIKRISPPWQGHGRLQPSAP